jgi:predicted transcriptional regulator
MSRLREHLDHIRDDVVPQRGAAQDGLDELYIKEVEARAQPPHLVRGLEQWNAGRFYEQHETLEWLWRATPDPVRDALKGIIQSGVGAYHVLNGNRRGALGKWTGAIGYLEPFEGLRPYGIDTGALRRDILALRQALLDDDREPPDWPAHQARARALRVHWEPRIAEPRVTALLRRIDRAWQDSPSSLEAAVAGLAAREADVVVSPPAPSIRNILAELASQKSEIVACCFDGSTVVEAHLALEEWRRFRRWLTEAHDALREPVGFLRDSELDSECVHAGESVRIEEVVQATIERDLFYAGQIQLLRILAAHDG